MCSGEMNSASGTGHRAPILRPRHQTPPEFVEGHLPVLTGDVVKKRLDLPSPRAKHLLDVHHRHRPSPAGGGGLRFRATAARIGSPPVLGSPSRFSDVSDHPRVK